MELTARQFAEMVQHLKGPARFGGPADQRRAPRVERQARITIIPVVDGKPPAPVAVEVKNVSSRGIGIARDQRMKPGAQFLVRLPRQGGDPAELLCTVVHCAPAGKGVYSVGAEFTCLAPTPGPTDSSATDRIRNSILE